MDTQGVEVLHVAHGDAVVVCVTDDLVLDLLPALERLLDQNLGREGQGPGGHVAELLLVVGETGPQATKRIGSADNNGVADLGSGIQSLVDRVDGNGLGNRDVDLLKRLGEQISVLTELQCPHTGAENSDAVFLKEPHRLHLYTKIEGRLATEREEDSIRLFLLDDVLDVLGGDGEVVDLVGEAVVGLDGGNVRVDEHRGHAGLLEGLEGLRSCMGGLRSASEHLEGCPVP